MALLWHHTLASILGFSLKKKTHPTLRNQLSSLSSMLSLEARSIQDQTWMPSFLDTDLNVLPIIVPSNMSHNIMPKERGNILHFSISKTTTPQHLDDMTRLRSIA
jgi:hypothetical protein